MHLIVRQDNTSAIELKKHVAAIHSLNRLSLLQRKIANALLYNAYNLLHIQTEYQISIKKLCELIGYRSNDHEKIKQALVKLISTVIEWNLIDDDYEGETIWKASAILADATIKRGICIYSYSQNLRELFYHPSIYGKINMEIQARFKSSYGLALYENCIRYRNVAKTPWITLTLFKKLMGVEETQYSQFKDFKKNVLQIAIKEVNAHSDIRINVQMRKTIQKRLEFQFLIEQSPVVLNEKLEQKKGLSSNLIEYLKNKYGFTLHKAQLLIEGYGEEYIWQKISLIENSNSFKQGKIANLTRYLEKALIENYQQPKSSQEYASQINNNKAIVEHIDIKKRDRLKLYDDYRRQELKKIFEELSEQDKSIIEKEFTSYIEPKRMYFQLYQKDGLHHPLVIMYVYEYMLKHRKDLTANVISFEFFCKNLDSNEN